jgi:hypothetical protein
VLAIWAIATTRMVGTRVETNKPTTAIVENGRCQNRRATPQGAFRRQVNRKVNATSHLTRE